MTTLLGGLRWWLLSYVKPAKIFRELRDDPCKVSKAAWINLVFALLYCVPPLMAYHTCVLPAIPPWMPIPKETYYLYQPLWTVPWAFATWILMGGIAHLLVVAGQKKGARSTFDDSLAVVAVGWVTPWLLIGLIPEAVVIPILGLHLPAWAEILRSCVLPEVWQTALIAGGLHVIHGVGWPHAIGVALLCLAAFFAMFLAFMR